MSDTIGTTIHDETVEVVARTPRGPFEVRIDGRRFRAPHYYRGTAEAEALELVPNHRREPAYRVDEERPRRGARVGDLYLGAIL